MAISILTDCCVEKNYREYGTNVHRLAHKLAYFVDLVAGAAILAIGLLGFFGRIPMQPNLAYSLIGAGAAYTILSLLKGSLALKQKCCVDAFLISDGVCVPKEGSNQDDLAQQPLMLANA